ncbi:MAG: OmpA family protein [Ignavibacteriaceae bacterium]
MFKKILVLFVVLFNAALFPQAFESKWGVGVGGIYPRFFSVTGTGFSGNENYGAYFSVERYFNEQVSLRSLFNFTHLNSVYTPITGGAQEDHTLNQFAVNLDVLYKFLPCRLVSPYVLFGLGATNFTNDNSYNPDVDDTFFGYQFNLGAGIEWGFNEDLALKTEAVYRTASNNKIDGNERLNENSKGLFGGNADTYATFDLGIVWYFSKDNRSDICDKCPEGYREVLIRDTVYIEKIVEKRLVDTIKVINKTPYLFGVNFAFDKYELNTESYAVLERAVETLKQNPDMDIVISGFTDNKGSNEYNQKLSEDRVNTVFNYLVSNGISPNRILKNWFGEEKPVKENNSDINRAFNRRVEIKIKN